MKLSIVTSGIWFLADLHRRRGEALLALEHPDPIAAEAEFHEALAISRRQAAHLWELRAATSLARLWARQDRIGDARAVLAPVYMSFAAETETPDLKDAADVLAQLDVVGCDDLPVPTPASGGEARLDSTRTHPR